MNEVHYFQVERRVEGEDVGQEECVMGGHDYYYYYYYYYF